MEKPINKFVVTTTIYPPSKATLAYSEIAASKNWRFIIVGDRKTPHAAYENLALQFKGHVQYLSPEAQDAAYPEVSAAIGWNCIQRRNIGFLLAYHQGADVVATVDDDNIPYPHWGEQLFVGSEVEVEHFAHQHYDVFDPLSITSEPDLWHRGYPIEYVPQKNQVESKGRMTRRVLVQADLWNGDPDVDALCRLSKRPEVTFETLDPYAATQIAPFNSQNTFLAREVLPHYAVLPEIGRMDDIWGSYILQHYFPDSVLYASPSVYQERNEQDLITNLEKEIIGYRHSLALLQDLKNYPSFLPEKTNRFLEVYRNAF